MVAIEIVPIGSVFKMLRACLGCGNEFYPPKRPDRLILDYCSPPCERQAGLRPMVRTTGRQPGCQSSLHHIANADRHRGPRTTNRVVRSAFAARLVQRRLTAGLTQLALAQAIGASERAVAGWELDRSDPSLHNFAALADLFGVTLDALYRGETSLVHEGAS